MAAKDVTLRELLHTARVLIFEKRKCLADAFKRLSDVASSCHLLHQAFNIYVYNEITEPLHREQSLKATVSKATEGKFKRCYRSQNTLLRSDIIHSIPLLSTVSLVFIHQMMPYLEFNTPTRDEDAY